MRVIAKSAYIQSMVHYEKRQEMKLTKVVGPREEALRCTQTQTKGKADGGVHIVVQRSLRHMSKSVTFAARFRKVVIDS